MLRAVGSISRRSGVFSALGPNQSAARAYSDLLYRTVALTRASEFGTVTPRNFLVAVLSGCPQSNPLPVAPSEWGKASSHSTNGSALCRRGVDRVMAPLPERVACGPKRWVEFAAGLNAGLAEQVPSLILPGNLANHGSTGCRPGKFSRISRENHASLDGPAHAALVSSNHF